MIFTVLPESARVRAAPVDAAGAVTVVVRLATAASGDAERHRPPP